MNLLHEIQGAILEPKNEIGPILLKLRFLAARLGSTELEDWVKHEAEGYPAGVDVPEYRKSPVTYHGSWSGPFGSSINNAQIPTYLIEKFAGKNWTNHEMRQSIAAVDHLANGEGEILEIDASNLILVLQGKIYEGYGCISVKGRIPKSIMREIQNAVRNRILDLTIKLEKAVPAAADVTLGKSAGLSAGTAETVTQIFNQTINGNYTGVTNTGAGAQITLNITKGDGDAVVSELIKVGIPQKDAEEFAKAIASEVPESSERPFGKRAQEWVARNISKAIGGSWKISLAVGSKILEEAALRYYGLK